MVEGTKIVNFSLLLNQILFMEIIQILGDKKQPSIFFDHINGILEIKGRSIVENTVEFYIPLLRWMDEYIASDPVSTTVNFHFEYLNTSSQKFVLEIFKKIEKLMSKSPNVTVNWYFDEDDEDMEECGEDFQEVVKIPMNMIELTEE